MKFNQYLTEKRNNNVIVVDIQPFYIKWSNKKFKIYEFIEFLNGQRKILYFYNGDSTGIDDNKNSIYNWLVGEGLTKPKNDFTFIDKGYGFFRTWMDLGIDEGVLKKAIRFMYFKKVNDSRDISEEEWEEFENEIEEDIFDNITYDDPIYLPDVSISLLRKYNGSFIVGGSKDECLKEVEILMSVFNIKAIRVKEFIY